MPIKLFLSEEGLLALHGFGFFGATVVGVAFLYFRRDRPPAFPAAQEAGEGLGFALRLEMVRPLFKDALHFVKERFGNEGQVSTVTGTV